MQIGTFLRTRKASTLWTGLPSGLGHFDIALYLQIGRELQRRTTAPTHEPASILDLGTYFGHSAFTFLQGAAQTAKHPNIRILSLDIFEQPGWLLTQPDIAAFAAAYGSAGQDGVAKALRDHCARANLPSDSITLWKKDVNQLTTDELANFAPEGFDAIAIDCGKTPELMNRIVSLICDAKVTRVGSLLSFQDFFDWHSPWNVVAFWKLLKLGFIHLHSVEAGVAPVAAIAKHGDPGLVCDGIEHRDPDWYTTFTDEDSELAAFDGMIRLLDQIHRPGLALRASCLRVGALLRHGRLQEAEMSIQDLDARWPIWLRDFQLRDTYRRYMHIKTGTKDLTLELDTDACRHRARYGARLLQKAHNYADYLRSPEAPRRGCGTT